MKRTLALTVLVLVLISGVSWARGAQQERPDALQIVATTGHIGDAVARIAPEAELTVLMGPGRDPHTYFPSTREVQLIQRADLVLYNGLELEIQMTGALEDLGGRSFAVGEAIPEHMLLAWEGHHHHHHDHGHGHDHDGHDHGHDHDHHHHDHHGDDVANVIAHACRHLNDDAVTVRSVLGGTPPEISGTHTRFQVSLASATGDRGRIVYKATRASDYLFLLDRDMRLEVFDAHGNRIADEEHGHGPVDGCPTGIKYYVFQLGHGDYTLAFSRGDDSSIVNLVVERIDADHHDHGHGHDHDHDHDHHHDDDHHGHGHGHDHAHHDHDHGEHDPHIWHDLDIWTIAVEAIAERIAELDPENRDVYRRNATQYVAELRELRAYATERFAEVPRQQRVLVTSHDAFGYLARAYGFTARGILGISTEDEAGVRDIQELADFVVQNNVRAIFFETAVDQRAARALQEAVQARGGSLVLSEQPLYSDVLGEREPVNTFLGAYRHNVDTIVDTILGNR